MMSRFSRDHICTTCLMGHPFLLFIICCSIMSLMSRPPQPPYQLARFLKNQRLFPNPGTAPQPPPQGTINPIPSANPTASARCGRCAPGRLAWRRLLEVKQSVSGCDVLDQAQSDQKPICPQAFPYASIHLLTRTADGVSDVIGADLVRDEDTGASRVVAHRTQGVEVCHVMNCGVVC